MKIPRKKKKKIRKMAADLAKYNNPPFQAVLDQFVAEMMNYAIYDYHKRTKHLYDDTKKV